jgi:hypothetical protein
MTDTIFRMVSLGFLISGRTSLFAFNKRVIIVAVGTGLEY